MNIASIDIKDMLEADSNLGLVFAENLFIGREPTTPNECITLFDTSSQPPAKQFEPTVSPYYYDSIQIRVRSTDYEKAVAICNDIRTSLHGRANDTRNGALYTVVLCASGPAMLDWDDENRVRFIINFDLQRREA